MRKMGIGLGVGINRSNYAQGIFNAYSARVVADGGVTEAGQCVDAVSSLLQSASLLLIPSGYKGGKLYSEIPTNGNGDLTWTRGSDAFRTNASGLIQRVPWNLLQYSEQFDNAYWSKALGTITANATTAPDGTLTADLFTKTSAINTVSQLGSPTTVYTTTGAYTLSVYLKPNVGNIVLLRLDNGGNTANFTFNFTTKTFSNFGANVISSSFDELPNGWFRLIVTGNVTSTSWNLTPCLLFANPTNDSMYIWGAQLVEGTTAQTYLPTTDRLNFPRLSYMYGSCPALLLEPQRTNLALYSEQFDNASWLKGNTTATANTTISPDGTTNADTITIQTTSGNNLRQNITVTANTTYTFSFYALRGTATDLRYSVFNFSGGSDIVAVTSYYSQTNSTTWSRITVTFTTPTGCTSIGVYPVRDATSTGTFFIYGAQLELGAYPTTYIPTTSATATRVADSFSRSNIYTNGLISASGGTWFVEFRNNVSYTRDVASAGLLLGNPSDGTTNSFFFLAGSPSRLSIFKRVAGVFTNLYLTTTDTTKIAIKWNGSTADIFANGTKVISATSFTATDMEFLSGNAGDVPKFIQQMALFNSPLSDAQCQTLTTL